MTIYRSGIESLGYSNEETAYIELNGNLVVDVVVIDDYVLAHLDEDDYLVGLDLLSLKHVPTLEDLETEVFIEPEDEWVLEDDLEELGAYSRIRRAFGN